MNFKKIAAFGAALLVMALGIWACKKYADIDPSSTKFKSKKNDKSSKDGDIYLFSVEEAKTKGNAVPMSITSSSFQEYNFRVAVDTIVTVSITRSGDTAFVTTQPHFTTSTSTFFSAGFLSSGFVVTDLADTVNNLKEVSFSFPESNGKRWLIQVSREPNISPVKNNIALMEDRVYIKCICDSESVLSAGQPSRPCNAVVDGEGWFTCVNQYCNGCCLTFVKVLRPESYTESPYRKSGLLGLDAVFLVLNGVLYQ
jgi:hypothetical protein